MRASSRLEKAGLLEGFQAHLLAPRACIGPLYWPFALGRSLGCWRLEASVQAYSFTAPRVIPETR